MTSYQASSVKTKVLSDGSDGTFLRNRTTFPSRRVFCYVTSRDGLKESYDRSKVYLNVDVDEESRNFVSTVSSLARGRIKDNIECLGLPITEKSVSTINVDNLFQEGEDGEQRLTFFLGRFTKCYIYDVKTERTIEQSATKLLNYPKCEYRLDFNVKCFDVECCTLPLPAPSSNPAHFSDVKLNVHPFLNISCITLIRDGQKPGDPDMEEKQRIAEREEGIRARKRKATGQQENVVAKKLTPEESGKLVWDNIVKNNK